MNKYESCIITLRLSILVQVGAAAVASQEENVQYKLRTQQAPLISRFFGLIEASFNFYLRAPWKASDFLATEQCSSLIQC